MYKASSSPTRGSASRSREGPTPANPMISSPSSATQLGFVSSFDRDPERPPVGTVGYREPVEVLVWNLAAVSDLLRPDVDVPDRRSVTRTCLTHKDTRHNNRTAAGVTRPPSRSSR